VRHESDEAKVQAIRATIRALARTCTLIAPAQALGELFVVLRRSGASAAEARTVLIEFSATFAAPMTTPSTVRDAADLTVDHGLQFWDAVIITAAAELGCQILLSEDMQHGFVTRGLTIINPFASPLHPKLVRLSA
jgi:predicted nucleic acid-binding protein